MLQNGLERGRASGEQAEFGCVLFCRACNNKGPQTEPLTQSPFIFRPFWSVEVQHRGSGGLVSSEARLLCLSVVTLYLRPHVVLSLVCWCLNPSSYEDSGHGGLGPTLMTSFSLNCLFKDPISMYGYFLSPWGLGLPMCEFWKVLIQPLMTATNGTSRWQQEKVWMKTRSYGVTFGGVGTPSFL